METITKEKIASHIENTLGLSGVICEEIVSQIFKSAENIIIEEGALKLKNFGSFKIAQKSERPGMNIRAKTPVSISARKVIKFSPSRNLKSRLNHNG